MRKGVFFYGVGYYSRLLKRYDVVLPVVANMNECIYEEYKMHHLVQDMDRCRDIISEKFPDYLEAFDKTMNSNRAVFCNVLVAKKSVFDDYCEFIFGVLEEFSKQSDLALRDSYQARACGFLGERLLNVYFARHDELKIIHEDLYTIENWGRFDSIKRLFAAFKRKLKI